MAKCLQGKKVESATYVSSIVHEGCDDDQYQLIILVITLNIQ